MRVAWRKYRNRWWILFLISAIITASYGYYTYHYQPKRYTSSMRLYALPSSSDGTATYNEDASRMIAGDCAQLLQNPELRQRAEEKLSPDSIEGLDIALAPVAGTHLLELSATGPEPSLCQKAVTAASVVLMEQMQGIAGLHSVTIAQRAQLPLQPISSLSPQGLALIMAGSFFLLSLLFLFIVPKKKVLLAEDRAPTLSGVPVLGTVADFRKDLSQFFKGKDQRYASMLPSYINRSAIEDIRALSLSLKGSSGQEGSHSLVVASSGEDEGKSSLVALLACELCNQGKRVLLIDMDCYAPTLARLLSVQGQVDLIHYLAGEATLDQIMLPTGIANLFLVDHCHPQSYASQVIGSAGFAGFMQLMHQEFDYILFDTPPVSLFADAATLGSVLDGTLLVVANGRQTEQAVKETVDKLKNAQNQVIGILFSFARAIPAKQYRDYEDVARRKRMVHS